MLTTYQIKADPIYHDHLSPATAGSAGLDLRVADESVTVHPQATATVDTGFAIYICDYHLAGLVLPRSGLAKNGITLANSIGLIDSDYQGTIKVTLMNRNRHIPLTFKRGDRIAQLIIVNVVSPKMAKFQLVKNFSFTTKRGEQGHGSTGVK